MLKQLKRRDNDKLDKKGGGVVTAIRLHRNKSEVLEIK